MQVIEEIDNELRERMIEPFNRTKMIRELERPEVKEVRVFKLTEGVRFSIEGQEYKVIRVRDNGKITIKEM